MAGELLSLDTQFPGMSADKPVEQRISEITDYLYMLREGLHHALRNLSMTKNMNRASVEQFTGMLTKPIFARIEDGEGRLSQLAVTADAIKLQVADVERGVMSAVTQTAEGIRQEVADLGRGLSSSITQTAAGIRQEVADVERGVMSAVTQTASEIRMEVSGLTGQVASLQMSVNGINLTGFVTFSSLQTPGATTIDGGNVKSGTISGVTLRSVSGERAVEITDGGVNVFAWPSMVGGLRYDTNGQAPYAKNRVFLYSMNGTALKIEALGADLSIESVGGTVWAMGNWNFYGATVTGLGSAG